MSELTTEPNAWDFDRIAEQLSDGLGRVLQVRGSDASALKARTEPLREALGRRDLELLSLDAADASCGAADLRELTVRYTRNVEAIEDLPRRARRLLDVVTDVRFGPDSDEAGGVDREQLQSALSELWAVLAAERPAVVLVLHPGSLAEDDRRLLERLVRTHFAQTIESIVPELDRDDAIDLAFVLAGSTDTERFTGTEVRSSTLDLSAQARASIREQLADDAIVDRFVASTGGDPDRLSRLVESLPDNCESFWRFRYRALDGEARDIVDLLAVAGRALPAASLRRFLREWRGRTLDNDRVRRLCEEGYLRRDIDGTTLRLELADVEFRRGLAGEIEAARKTEIHRAIAEAAQSGYRNLLDERFVARHSLEAGRIEQGFRFGLQAAENLYARHALEEARDLFERLLECSRESDVVGEAERDEILSYLVDLLGDLGELDAAIQRARELEEGLEDGPFAWRIRLERARLHVRIGEYAEADAIFEALRERFTPDEEVGFWASAIEGLANSRYARGDEQRAEEIATRLIDELERREVDGVQRAQEALFEARSVVGRIALYRGERERARELFESNRLRAHDWNWTRKRRRAETNLAAADLQACRYSEAAEALEELLEGTPTPTPERRMYILVNLGMARQRLGQYAGALEAYRDVFRVAHGADDDVVAGIAAYNLATLCQDFCAYDRVLELADWLQERKFDDDRHRFVGALPEALRANALLARNEYEAAIDSYDAVDEAEHSAVDLIPTAKLRLRKAIACVRSGRRGRAEEIVEALETSEQAANEDTIGAWFELVQALLADDAGDWSRAATLAASAENSLRESGDHGDARRAAVIRIRALANDGRREEAERLVEKRLLDFRERAESVPAEFRSQFHEGPSYRRLVELARELHGGLPEGVSAPQRGPDSGERGGEATSERTDVQKSRLRCRYSEIVGRDEQVLEVLSRIDRVAASEAPILIQGESGSGKELVAQAVHRESARDSGAPFVKVNCGAFVDNLLLSELFGHEEGAFTGAVEQQEGCFERADGGTIFLDEIGEVSPKAQVALLRVLQEGEFERVGGSETHCVDVRVVCATNRDLESMVESGAFRLDLYYRLKGVVLEMPPLRERRRDIPLLVRHFAEATAPGRNVEFSRRVLEFLASYRWPGNVRELRNFVESVLLFADGGRVEMRHLREFGDFFPDEDVETGAPEFDVTDLPEPESHVEPQVAPTGGVEPERALVEEIVGGDRDLKELQQEIQREAIRRALERTDGNITRAAEILEMSRPRLSQIVNGDDELLELKEQLVA